MHTRGGRREDNTQKKGDVIRKVKRGKAKEHREKEKSKKEKERGKRGKVRVQREETIEERT
jgi:hypothetical protein